MNTPAVIKTLAAAVILGSLGMMGMGCAQQPNTITDTDWTPGYSFWEDQQRIGRYMHYDQEQMIDDVDRDLLLLRPSSHLTWWNVTELD